MARRATRQHTYLSVKDEFALDRLTDSEKKDIWTSIGFIFADGSVTDTSVAIVVTEGDSYYLSQYILPSLLDKTIPNNIGPRLITAQSVNHATSFSGSRAVARLHIEDSMFASFIQSIGMPPNKTSQGHDIGPDVRQLDDPYFFCFLNGLFDGDGCITHGSTEGFSLHLDFDLHSQAICHSLADEILRRTGIKMVVHSHETNAGKRHFKLSASTTPRALALLAHMYAHSNFQLQRKVRRADELMLQLQSKVVYYRSLAVSFDMLAKGSRAAPDNDLSFSGSGLRA